MYQTDTLAKNGADRNRVQNVDGTLERFHKLPIVSSESAKNMCLFMKNGGDGFNRVAFFKLLGEGVFD
jgi:hypothetical protein